MILRSVVGKLWLTIILLVSIVLIALSLFLNQQVDKSYNRTHKHNLERLANEVKTKHVNLNQVQEVGRIFDTYMVVVGPNGTVDTSISKPSTPQEAEDVLQLVDMNQVRQGKQFTGTGKINSTGHEIMFVAVPYSLKNGAPGAVVFYQQLNESIEEDIKKWILYSALIAIALTTIFAFFLSSRITQPLIQMKKAAEKIARGDFSARVRVREHERDEIADLTLTFNRMAGQLDDLVNMLSHEKEQLTSILRSMTDGVITLNAKGKVIMTNPPADRLLAIFREPGNLSFKATLPPPLKEFFDTVVKEEKEIVGDITEQGRTWAVVMAPLYARGQLRGAVAVFRDVTEERRLDKMRKDFVANVSHELRTPLAMLQGYSEALIDDIAQSPEEIKEIAQVINEESMRMGRLVRELLDLARMEAGHIQMHLSHLDVTQFIQRVVRKFQALARERGVEVTGEVAENLPIVRWDEDKIEQVLTNLIDNAIRHTPEGGAVTVRAFQSGKHIFLEVEDTGTGIPEEDLPFVFERFYKADKARTRGKGKSGGTGLGLSIVKHLVNAHLGNVTVRSQVGKGTVFSVQLPVEVPEEVEAVKM
ncbi:ATP-binding protein [Thermoflavimicrobium dichotomicum]|uniref:histidine kinase n=1 Tax=Thermoflavimicrobium dichotomicum TaxID=46223 RepID=A0A1I3TUH5_9BACL|nr:ATP-binding protein [Thermoflavimicrobium dichotomicum]SFJ74928.1 two-component system, OmpR family, sensor histidine kinase ResE [Thermoflavimicrobium dichotomicum]